ncbi:hypothetical protein F2P81_010186 [Scophthalmus maximus]|uniref:Uncharacterized protein n=1 Tax=Scophthalmus maximus TaxID=52904 RepID=A0A6A4T557_SCOMX|nr:hypothetical protein F2P81_010186 [Scophthalmus maximus]
MKPRAPRSFYVVGPEREGRGCGSTTSSSVRFEGNRLLAWLRESRFIVRFVTHTDLRARAQTVQRGVPKRELTKVVCPPAAIKVQSHRCALAGPDFEPDGPNYHLYMNSFLGSQGKKTLQRVQIWSTVVCNTELQMGLPPVKHGGNNPTAASDTLGSALEMQFVS